MKYQNNRAHKSVTNPGHWIFSLLNIRTGEGKPVMLLILFSFFMGLALTFYFTASNAIFIKHFEPRMISLAFMASGIAVYLTWLLLAQIDKRLPANMQFIFKFTLVILCVAAISIGTWLRDSDLMAFILFAFVRVLVYISLVTFWGLAGKLFNLRQGKRIFGLIGTGEVISLIIGYFSVPIVLHFVKTPFLLFISSFAFLLCFIVVLIILRNYREQVGSTRTASVIADKQEKKQWRYMTLLKKPYFFLTSLMALLPIFGYLFVDFMFLRQTKYEFNNDQETIAGFFGYILGFVAVVELVFKLFVSGRLLNKYGLRLSLLSLPFALLVSTTMAALFGTFFGPAGIFFTFIVFSRLLERSVRGAIYEPAFQLLYQPVASEQRLAFQSQIEGIPKALGTVLTGAILLLFSSIQTITLVHYNFFFLLIIALWIVYAIRMYRSYRGRIKELLTIAKARSAGTPLSPTAACISDISDFIVGQDAGRFRKLFHLIEKVDPVKADQALQELLIRSSEPLKAEIIQFVGQNQVISAKEVLINLYASQKQDRLNPLLEAALSELKLADSYSVDLLSNLSRSKDAEEREVAARLLANSPRYKTIKILSELLRDPHPTVREAALIAAGKVKRVELWPGIVENLSYPEYVSTAFSALRNIGEPVIDELEDLFRKTGTPQKTQILIIKLYRSIGGPRAIKHLRSKISFPDMDTRLQVLLALSKLNYKADHHEQAMIKQTIESNIEVMVWIMASIQDMETDIRSKHLLSALQEEFTEEREHIFLLLSLIYDAQTIRLIRSHIESGNSQSKIFALEISDMMVSGDIKEILLPLFDDIPTQERLSLFRFRFPQEKLSCLNRIADIINKDYNVIRNWTKACAIELLIHYDKAEVAEILRANIVNPSRMISETAAWVLHAMDQDMFYDVLAVQRSNDKIRLESVTKKMGIEKPFQEKLLITEKTESLKSSGLFAGIPDHILAELAVASLDLSILKGQHVAGFQDEIHSICLVLSGQIDLHGNKQAIATFKGGDVFIKDPDRTTGEDVYHMARKDSLLLMINMDLIIDLMRDYPVFTRKFLAWY